MALQNQMRCPKNGIPILLQSNLTKDRIGRPTLKTGRPTQKNHTTGFCVKEGNRDIRTPKTTGFALKFRFLNKPSEQWMSLTHKNNLISHSRFSPSQATQARSQPKMVTNGGSGRRIDREQTITKE
ncbi:hypothetical protein M9H77_11792 [Catharanthus roseus]|uniref:Uncharacterized protein n=1 Tax=Catharanthus roseus TaxID=4058 RepID=A0ACC0BFN0_CATRO|nr:hypothetical protein M9H77_11792 [Catharanthus roseus]